jgi:hypothetical protein
VVSKPFSVLCLWWEEQRIYVDSRPFFATEYGGKNNEYICGFQSVYDGKNYNYLEVPKQSPPLIMAGRATSVCGIQTNFRTMLIAGRLTIIRATEGVRAYP